MYPARLFYRYSVVFLLLIALASALTSCAPTATETPVTPSIIAVITPATTTNQPTAAPSIIPAITTATPTTRPTETPIPTDTPTPFVPRGTIKIASQGPLTGGLSWLGTDIMRGAELAVRQLADPLMELGYEVELVPYDDQDDIEVAVANAHQIVSDPDVLCLVGPFTSRIVNQVKEIYHRAGLAFVSPSATAAYVTASGYLEVNRLVGREDAQGVAGAQFAEAKGFSRAFIISQNENFSQFIANHFNNEASSMGINMVGNMSTDATENFGLLIDRVIASNADLVYFSTLNVGQAGAFFREARAAGYTGAFLGIEGINNPALLEFAGPLLIEGGGMYYTVITAPASYYPGATKFLEDFETLYGVTPQIFTAQAYDAAGICLKAIEEASKAKGGQIPTREEVAKVVRALQDYPGITGIFNFDENGDPDPAEYFVFQVVSVDPDDWDNNPLVASFDLPPPE